MGGASSSRHRKWGALAAVAMSAAIGLTLLSTAAPSGAASKSGSLSQPVKLGFLWEVQGESSVAINDFQNGAKIGRAHV